MKILSKNILYFKLETRCKLDLLFKPEGKRIISLKQFLKTYFKFDTFLPNQYETIFRIVSLRKSTLIHLPTGILIIDYGVFLIYI